MWLPIFTDSVKLANFTMSKNDKCYVVQKSILQVMFFYKNSENKYIANITMFTVNLQ